eukprot:m51a1_g13456 hypothetical protein (161) ;mRNA; f:1642-2207
MQQQQRPDARAQLFEGLPPAEPARWRCLCRDPPPGRTLPTTPASQCALALALAPEHLALARSLLAAALARDPAFVPARMALCYVYQWAPSLFCEPSDALVTRAAQERVACASPAESARAREFFEGLLAGGEAAPGAVHVAGLWWDVGACEQEPRRPRPRR